MYRPRDQRRAGHMLRLDVHLSNKIQQQHVLRDLVILQKTDNDMDQVDDRCNCPRVIFTSGPTYGQKNNRSDNRVAFCRRWRAMELLWRLRLTFCESTQSGKQFNLINSNRMNIFSLLKKTGMFND